MRLRWRTHAQTEPETPQPAVAEKVDPRLQNPKPRLRADRGRPDPLSWSEFKKGRSGPSIRLDQKF